MADDKLQDRYKDHGESQECFEGEGGHEAINVYNITGKFRKKLNCLEGCSQNKIMTKANVHEKVMIEFSL